MDKSKNIIKLPPKIAHIGIVVRNMEKVMKNYTDIFGVGPWRTGEAHGKDGVKNGKPMAPYTFKVASAMMGQVAIELLEPVEGDTVWQEYLDTHGEGVHHFCFAVENHAKEVKNWKEHGMSVTQYDKKIKYVYMNAMDLVGMHFELYPKKRETNKNTD